MRFLFILFSFFFSSVALAEPLILCSEYGSEGRRSSVLEAWLDQPNQVLKPNTCEQVLAQELKIDLRAEKLWAAGNAASVYRQKMLLDRLKSDWTKARDAELEELAASFMPKPTSLLVCVLRPIKDEVLRDFRIQYVYQADCKWKEIGSDRESCLASWTGKAAAETKTVQTFDPVIERIVQLGSLRLAKCLK